MRSHSFTGSITVCHPDTDEEFVVEYEGAYEPEYKRGSPDDWQPDNSWLEITYIPRELEFMEDNIRDLCWEDAGNQEDDCDYEPDYELVEYSGVKYEI